ncbi:MAG: L-aspartate oxidase [Candidatus Bipolaricaulota bacterium]|nr:L-aspartate oxidase [Candidatus Bipolaricaulota bacterium]MDW8141398.1 L-aspartate oxidase [Candidatus Bipolaricaulota bacterium]
MDSRDCDVLVIGAGIAGLYAALLAGEHGRVLLLTKASLSETNSAWAQGGIAAAVEEHDSPQLHLEDTLRAGRGLCDPQAVAVLVSEGPDCVRDLERLGVQFDRAGREYLLGREGGHSRRRIVQAGGSSTGRQIVEKLSQLVTQQRHIELLESAYVTELLVSEGVCAGVRCVQNQKELLLRARVTILATGGAAALYERTTNPPGATGDGMALAYRAGAELMDMEFVQFHPTALALPHTRSWLITEAIRGEGAYLLNAQHERFMPRYDERAELAPRDVVARAIFEEMRTHQSDHVFLDLRHLNRELLRERFPNIWEMLNTHGLDPARDLIPVAPAAHYTLGGIRTDLHAHTNIQNLYAVGEVACTGVHGANRLASNSLLECLVFARRAGQAALKVAEPLRTVTPSAPQARPSALPPTLPPIMTRYVGLVRDREGLEYALARLAEMGESALVGRLIAQSALLRTESRGVHIRRDHTEENSEWLAHIIMQKEREPQIQKIKNLTNISGG